MRRYETIVIIDPDLSAEMRNPLIDRIKDLITEMGGLFIALDEWGSKKLAYEIKKKHRGYYARFDFCGSAALVQEIERVFQIDDRVLKYITVLLDKTPDVEQIKEDLAQAAKAATEAEAEAAKADAKTAEAESPAAQGAGQSPNVETSPENTASSEPETETDETPADPAGNTE